MGALISYRNLADAGTITASAGLPGYPATNLQTRQLTTVSRVSSSLGGFWTVDLGSVQTVSLVALLAVNPPGVPPPPPTYWIDALVQYSVDGVAWTTAIAQVQRDSGSPDLPFNLLLLARTAGGLKVTTARYWRITPAWNMPAGVTYYESGRLWIGDTIDIPTGCDSGWSLDGRDPGTLDESAGLQIYADRRVRGRVLSMPLSGIDTTVAYGFAENAGSVEYTPSLDDLINYAGATGEVIAVPRVESAIWTRRTGVYGHLTPDSLRLRHMSGPKYACDLTVIEER